MSKKTCRYLDSEIKKQLRIKRRLDAGTNSMVKNLVYLAKSFTKKYASEIGYKALGAISKLLGLIIKVMNGQVGKDDVKSTAVSLAKKILASGSKYAIKVIKLLAPVFTAFYWLSAGVFSGAFVANPVTNI